MPIIESAHYRKPGALRGEVVIPAYWTIPNRCYLYTGRRTPAPWHKRITAIFGAFKIGERRFAYPLAAGIAAALKKRCQENFDAIVPIPLSPEKAAKGELNRTAILAYELSCSINAPRKQHLSLNRPISRRRMLAQGHTLTQFKNQYRQFLDVDPAIASYRRILLLDDAITRGATMSVAAGMIRAMAPSVEITMAAAAQMIVLEAISDQNASSW